MLPRAYRRNGGFGRRYDVGQARSHLPNSSDYRQCYSSDSDGEEEVGLDSSENDDDESVDNQPDPCIENKQSEGDDTTEEEEDADLEYNNYDGPVEKWGNKCKAKQIIISEMKKEVSAIHQYIPAGTCLVACFTTHTITVL